MSPAGKDAHTTRWHASDPVATPSPRGAQPKVMKGEDKWFATPDARWVPPGASPDDPDVHCHFSAFGLFDGHGGKDAAEHCVETMLPCLLAALDARGPVPPASIPRMSSRTAFPRSRTRSKPPTPRSSPETYTAAPPPPSSS